MSEGEKLLTQLEAQIGIARAALADEHEGDFSRAVAFITADAERLGRLVASW